MKFDKPGWRDFLELCSKIRTKEEFEQVYDLFFTIEEKENIASRYLIIKELLEETLTQREIAETHSVSIAQITRGSNALKIIPKKLRDTLKKKFNIS